jgi:hypothetical protein
LPVPGQGCSAGGHQSANNKRQDTEKQSVFLRGGDVEGNEHRLPRVVHRPVAGRQAGRPPVAARGGNTGAVIAKRACTWTEWDGGTDLGCMRPGSASRLAVAAAAGRCQQREHEPLPPASPKHARSAMPLTLFGCCKSGSRGVFALRERREAERLPARDGGDLTRSNSAWEPATHTGPARAGPKCGLVQGVPGSAARKVPCDALNVLRALPAALPMQSRALDATSLAVIRTAGADAMHPDSLPRTPRTLICWESCLLLSSQHLSPESKDLTGEQRTWPTLPLRPHRAWLVISPYRQARLGLAQVP